MPSTRARILSLSRASAVCVLLLLALSPALLRAGTDNGQPDRVLGQLDLIHTAPNLVDERGFASPLDVAVDTSVTPNRLYVLDARNNRVLGWRDATGFANGSPADLILGQPDPSSTSCNSGFLSAASLCVDTLGQFFHGLAVDRQGNLYVSDTDNHRVLEYDAPFTTDTIADRVFGTGGSFTTSVQTCGNPSQPPPGPGTLCAPGGLAFDAAGNLYVADGNRVLEYDAPLATDTLADRVFGQDGSFASMECNLGGLDAGSLCEVRDVAVDAAGNLYAVDALNNRVLEYDAPLTTDTMADRVFGTGGSFTTVGGCPDGEAPSVVTICAPRSIAFDPAGNLWVSDIAAHRLLMYAAPLTTDAIADRFFGQPSFTSRESGCGDPRPFRFCSPAGIALDGRGNLFVADAANFRVLRFNGPPLDQQADAVLGQGDFLHASLNLLDRRGLDGPAGVAIDRSVTPNRIYVSDANNNRVLAWRDAAGFMNGAPADLVIGQPTQLDAGCNNGGVSARSLCLSISRDTGRGGLAVDDQGNLYVSDDFNHRVLEFDVPFLTDTLADRVYGQDGFETRGCNRGGRDAGSLCQPSAVAVDSQENLYIADTANNRVVAYRSALDETRSADVVFGQGGRFRTRACGGIGAETLCRPSGVAVDAAGNLFVSEPTRSRVLAFRSPLATDTVADRVLGQRGGSFTTGRCNNSLDVATASSLCAPALLTVDPTGDLYIADRGNDRVVQYSNPLSRPRVELILQQGLFLPAGVAVDEDGNVFVSVPFMNRVLAFDRP